MKDLSFIKNAHYDYKIYKYDKAYISAELFISTETFDLSIISDGYFAIEKNEKPINRLFFDNITNKYFMYLFVMPKQKTKQANKNIKTVIYLYKRFFGI